VSTFAAAAIDNASRFIQAGLSPLKFPVPAPAAPPRPLALRIGYDMRFELLGPQPTAMLLMLYVHPEIAPRLDAPERIVVEPLDQPIETFFDAFGNRCARVVAPPGELRLSYEAVYNDTYQPEPQPLPEAVQHPAGELPTDVLPF
jgi:hypothetical protein